jgi:VanZ family protein
MFLRRLRFAIMWAALILVVCLMPGSVVAQYDIFVDLRLDKWAHAFLFAVFYVLLVKGLRRQTTYEDLQHHAVLASFTVAVMYGGFVELLQEMMQLGRMMDVADMVANTVGVILGSVYLRWGEAWVMSRRHLWERYI